MCSAVGIGYLSSMRVKALDLINKLYFKFLDAHMTQCELDFALWFRGAWLMAEDNRA